MSQEPVNIAVAVPSKACVWLGADGLSGDVYTRIMSGSGGFEGEDFATGKAARREMSASCQSFIGRLLEKCGTPKKKAHLQAPRVPCAEEAR